MGENSRIEWTDATWNPVTGCTKVSQGCKHCYAETWARRGLGEFAKESGRKFTDVRCHEDKLEIPLRWKRPRRIFVNSMSDLFHEDVPDEFIWQVFRAMSRAHWHTFQILTKRAKRMSELVPQIRYMLPDRLNHVQLGVSVEDQKAADERIPYLLETRSAVHFLSCEPLLGPVLFIPQWVYNDHGWETLDWVIVGGESGPGARPMHPEWARSLRDQCQVSGVSFFFKQWGAWKPISEMREEESEALYYPRPKRDPNATQRCRVPWRAIGFDGGDHWQSIGGQVSYLTFKVGKERAGRELDGRTWDEFPKIDQVG